MKGSVKWFKVQAPCFPLKVEVGPDATDEQVNDALDEAVGEFFSEDSWMILKDTDIQEVSESWVKKRYPGSDPDYGTVRVGLPEEEMSLGRELEEGEREEKFQASEGEATSP